MKWMIGLVLAAAGFVQPAQAIVVAGNAMPSSVAMDNGFLVRVEGQNQVFPVGPGLPLANHWQWRFHTGDTDITSLTIEGINLGGALGEVCAPNYCRSNWSSWTAPISERTEPLTVSVVFNGITQTETVPLSMIRGFSILESPAQVPEPASLALLLGGLLALAASRRRR